MSVIGVREFAKRASAIINRMAVTGEPALITRRGRPVAYVRPIRQDEYEDFLLANAREFVSGYERVEQELADGKTVSFKEFRKNLESPGE